MPRLLSLVTCTHNPDPVLFRRLVTAVEALAVPPGWEREWIVVDHRSGAAVRDMAEVPAALARSPWMRVVREDEAPRIAGARARSIEEAAGEALIVFDDDCVPEPDYLLAAVQLLSSQPAVTCWGPGRVTLDWLERTPPAWLDARWRTTFFQERAVTECAWARERGWSACYASGVGMMLMAAPAREYARRVRDGRYSAVDRSNASVVRGEDGQMLWTAIALGGAAGVSPTLALRHAVAGNRLHLGYLRRLAYGLQESALPCQLEVFGIGAEGLPGRARAVRAQRRPLLGALRKLAGARRAQGVLEAAEVLGALSAIWRVQERPEPWWLRAAIAILRVR